MIDFKQKVIKNDSIKIDDKIVDFAFRKANDTDKCYDMRINRIIESSEAIYDSTHLNFSQAPKNGFELLANSYMIVGTGVSINFGEERIVNGVREVLQGEIKPRSGLGFKHSILPFNGQIDNSYNDEIMLRIDNLSNESYFFKLGEKIAQIEIDWKPILEDEIEYVDYLNELNGGKRGGFGSSGRG